MIIQCQQVSVSSPQAGFCLALASFSRFRCLLELLGDVPGRSRLILAGLCGARLPAAAPGHWGGARGRGLCPAAVDDPGEASAGLLPLLWAGAEGSDAPMLIKGEDHVRIITLQAFASNKELLLCFLCQVLLEACCYAYIFGGACCKRSARLVQNGAAPQSTGGNGAARMTPERNLQTKASIRDSPPPPPRTDGLFRKNEFDQLHINSNNMCF